MCRCTTFLALLFLFCFSIVFVCLSNSFSSSAHDSERTSACRHETCPGGMEQRHNQIQFHCPLDKSLYFAAGNNIAWIHTITALGHWTLLLYRVHAWLVRVDLSQPCTGLVWISWLDAHGMATLHACMDSPHPQHIDPISMSIS